MIWWGAGAVAGDRFAPPEARPFRAPHYTCSTAGLVGSVQAIRHDWRTGRLRTETYWMAVPGELSLAHAGVLMLDELPEFRRETLERVRNAMRDGSVTHGLGWRVDWEPATTIPSWPIVVGAMNPCPCGWAGSARQVCRCPEGTIKRYTERAGALLPYFPIRVRLSEMPLGQVADPRFEYRSDAVCERVARARAFASAHEDERSGDVQLPPGPWPWDLNVDRATVVARTIADLEGSATIERRHMLEALDWGRELYQPSA